MEEMGREKEGKEERGRESEEWSAPASATRSVSAAFPFVSEGRRSPLSFFL